MNINDKIRVMREVNQWSQEDMAEKMHMSTTGYAKIERGETKLNLRKLEQIANIFKLDILELINNENTGNKGIFVLMNENGNHTANYYQDNDSLSHEVEQIKLEVKYKEELILYKDEIIKQKDIIIEQKESEILALKEIISLLKKK